MSQHKEPDTKLERQARSKPELRMPDGGWSWGWAELRREGLRQRQPGDNTASLDGLNWGTRCDGAQGQPSRSPAGQGPGSFQGRIGGQDKGPEGRACQAPSSAHLVLNRTVDSTG